MVIILASIQICSPLLFGSEHSACQLGTVAVFNPFPKPVNVRLGSVAQTGETGLHTGNYTTNDKLVSGQALHMTVRLSGETQRGRYGTYSWYRGDLYHCPNRDEGSPYSMSCGRLC